MIPSSLRIGMIAFTNAEPFRLIQPAFPVEWTSGDPSHLAQQMREGNLDACLLPIGALPTLPEQVQPIGPYGIACCGHVLSLRIFSRIPLNKLLQPGHSVYITHRTTTTRLLVQELFAMRYGARPQVSDNAIGADARVLIGDEAMDLTREEFRWPIARDISEWWFEQTGLGFVFAQWMMAPHLNPEAAAALQQWLEASLSFAESEEGRAQLRKAGAAAGWSADISDLYFQRLNFRLQHTHLQGMAAFRERLKETTYVD